MKNRKIILTIPLVVKNRLNRHPKREEILSKTVEYLNHLLMNKKQTFNFTDTHAIFCSRFKYPETKFQDEILNETRDIIRVEKIRGRVSRWIRINTENFPVLEIRYIKLNAVGQFKAMGKITVREAKRRATETETIHYTKLDDFLKILNSAHGYVVGEKESFKGFNAAVASLSGENEKVIQEGLEKAIQTKNLKLIRGAEK